MTDVRDYICPGERYVIPRSVHLARLAAGYAACRECPLREDRPRDPSDVDRRPAPAERAHQSRLRRLFTTEGVRGTARNELDAATVERLAGALAESLWNEIETSGGLPPAGGFPVVVGYDDRPWSLALGVAAGTALRRSGCETIDLGLVTGPEFRFAVCHLDAVAGLLATGAGGGPAIAGLEFARAAGRPLSAGGSLDTLADRAEHLAGRPTRRGGRRREFRITAAYEAGLRRHITDAPLATGLIGTASPLLRERIGRLAETLTATLPTLLLPRRSLDAAGRDEPGLAMVAAAVRERGVDFGLWIGEDGITCRAIDEAGSVMPVGALAELAIGDALADRPAMPVVVDWTLAESRGGQPSRREQVVSSNGTAEAMWLSMRDHAAVVGADSTGRFWRPGPPLTGDALTTLAWLLTTVRRHGESLSQRVRATGGKAVGDGPPNAEDCGIHP